MLKDEWLAGGKLASNGVRFVPLHCCAAVNYAPVQPVRMGAGRNSCTACVAPPCRAIDSAASRLGPVLAALPQRLDPAAPDSAVVHMQHLDAACEVMIACLELAPACGSSSEVQLARTAVEHVLHSGYTALTVWTTCSELCQVCCASLGPQLDLVNQAVHTAGWSATAADEAAQPAQLAAWLAAAVHLLKLMADHCATGGGIGTLVSCGVCRCLIAFPIGVHCCSPLATRAAAFAHEPLPRTGHGVAVPAVNTTTLARCRAGRTC